MWTGRDKRDADRKLAEKKGRCVLRDDLHKSHHKVSDNQVTAPVVRNTSAACSDAVGVLPVLRCRHTRSGDVPTAYLQGDQTSSKQVLARSPHDFREFDERGVEILRLMNFQLYGQVDAGANWNRTFNNTMVAPRDGASSPNVTPIASESHEAEVDLRESGCAAVDQGKWNRDKSAGLGAERDRRHTFLQEGANRSASEKRDVVHVCATSYIDAMVVSPENYLVGEPVTSRQRKEDR